VFGILVGVLRILLVLLLVRLVARFFAAVIRGYLGPGRPAAAPAAPPVEVQLVRDPVCNTFVDPRRAFTREVDGRRAYYCSAACRDHAVVLAAAR
jgi:hypothetical protein